MMLYIDALNSTYRTGYIRACRLKQAETKIRPRVLQAGGGEGEQREA